MEVEQPGRSWPPARRPRRRATDRVEDAVAWFLLTVALLVAVAAVGIGGIGHDIAMDRVRAQVADRTMTRAVLLDPTAVPPGVDGSTPLRPEPVRARWLGPGGVEVEGTVTVAVRLPAGAPVAMWLDRAGRVVPAPAGAASAVATGWLWGMTTALAGWLMLMLVWIAVRRATTARNIAGWAREWAHVEPRWSGRVP